MKHINYLIAVLLILTTLLIYSQTRFNDSTPHNHFILLAESFLQGKVYLEDPPIHLELTGRDGDHIRYVAYPPMPAIMAMPFVAFNLFDKSQTIIAIVFAALSSGLFYLLTIRIFKYRVYAFLLTISLMFGTNLWYLATEGSSWYIAHVLAIFFIILALLTINLRRENEQLIASPKLTRWLGAGLLIGAAYWSRLPAILVTPFFLYVLFFSLNVHSSFHIPQISEILKKKWHLFALLAGIGFFVMCNGIYNYIRFGTFADAAYVKIQNVLNEPWYKDGIFSINYLKGNLEFFFLRTAPRTDQFPYFKPSIVGMSFFLTSPMFLLLPLVKWRKGWVVAAVLTGILMLIPGLLHGTPGFSQFGYRFAAEATPLFLLALGTLLEKKYGFILIPLIALSIAINYWGIYFIRVLHLTG